MKVEPLDFPFIKCRIFPNVDKGLENGVFIL